MGKILKIVLGISVLGLVSYLVMEILKLRNTVKILKIELLNIENFNPNSNSNIDIENEISEYKKDLLEADTIDRMMAEKIQNDLENEQSDSSNNDEYTHHLDENLNEQYDNHTMSIDPIFVEEEIINYDNIESEINHNEKELSKDNKIEELDLVDETETETETEIEIDTDIISDEIMKIFLNKYTKTVLKDLCSDNKLTKGGSKKDLITRLYTKGVLKKLNTEDFFTNTNKDHALHTVTDDTIEVLEMDTTTEIVETANSTEAVASTEDTIPTDSLLYNLRQLNKDDTNIDISLSVPF